MSRPIRTWVRTHPYLAPLASLHEAIEGVEYYVRPRRDPRSAEEIARGVPLLQSGSLDPAVFVEAGELLTWMVEALLETNLPEPLLRECGALCDLLSDNPEAATRLARSAVAEEASSSQIGRYVAWKALGRVLASTQPAAGWTANFCPTCGAPPAMAKLRESDRGRERALVCGRCGTSWRYARIGCPFCGNDSVDQLGVLEPEGEPEFRIDVCRRCDSYLKTYLGEGGEQLALSDWSTLQLDIASAERGLRRGGPSLYEP